MRLARAMLHALSTLCNKKSISKIWRRSAHEEHHENFTPNLCKTVLCWLGASMIIASEFTLHATCKKSVVFKQEGDVKCMAAELIFYFQFLEGVCRCCTAIVLVDMIWAVMVQMDLTTTTYDPTSPMSPASPVTRKETEGFIDLWRFLPRLIALVTLYVGCAPALFEHPSGWVNFYAHFCDIACHTVITTAIIGIIYETSRGCFALTCDGSQDCGILKGYCCCQVHVTADGLESGPILGSRQFEDFEVLQVQGFSWVVAKWLVFCGVALMYLRRIQDEDHFPRFLEICFTALNASCWAAMAYAISESLCKNWPRFFSAVADSKFVALVELSQFSAFNELNDPPLACHESE